MVNVFTYYLNAKSPVWNVLQFNYICCIFVRTPTQEVHPARFKRVVD